MSNDYQRIRESFKEIARARMSQRTLAQELEAPSETKPSLARSSLAKAITPILAFTFAYSPTAFAGNTDTKSIKPYNAKTPAVSYSHDELVLGDRKFIRKELEDDEEIVFEDKNREEVVLSRKVTLGGKFIREDNLEQVITKRKHNTAPIEEGKYHVLVAIEGNTKTPLHADRDDESNPTQISLETRTSESKTTSKTTKYTSRNKTLRNAIALKGIEVDGANLVVYPIGPNFTGLDKELSNREPFLFLRTDGKWGYDLITRITPDNVEDALQGVHYVLTQVMVRKKIEQDKQDETKKPELEISAEGVQDITPTKPAKTLYNILKGKPKEPSVPISPETRQKETATQQNQPTTQPAQLPPAQPDKK